MRPEAAAVNELLRWKCESALLHRLSLAVAQPMWMCVIQCAVISIVMSLIVKDSFAVAKE